ncbi:sugar phosphate isomerase/epimerase family protein [Halioxenophilus aromaticivorans]
MGLAAVTSACPTVLSSSNPYFQKPGLQLFTVMKLLDQDFEGTLSAVQGIGYRTVETVGAFGKPASQVKELLQQYNLYTPSQHLMPGTLYQDFSAYNQGKIGWDEIVKRFTYAFDFNRVEYFIEEAIGRAQTLGQDYIVWQLNWLPEYGKKELKQHVKAFNTAGKMCKEAGLQFAFHNHDHEFTSVGDTTYYDLLVQNTAPDLVQLEMDFMWATFAGADPVVYLKRYADRYKMVHLKDLTKDRKITIPGKGTENFQNLLSVSEQVGVQYAFVEFDQPNAPMQEIAEAYNYLTRIKKP